MDTTILQNKKAQLTVIEKLYETLAGIRKDNLNEYKVVGKKNEQARHWRTGELLWEDEEKTIPRYEDEYDYVPIPEENLTAEQKATLQAVHDIKKVLTSMI